MNIFIEYPKCSTCIKAKRFLDENGIKYEDRNIKIENPNYDELKAYYLSSGLDINKLFNTSGMLYRELGLKDKLPTLSIDDKLKLLASDGMLVKRPILVTKNKAYFGFKENEWKETKGN